MSWSSSCPEKLTQPFWGSEVGRLTALSPKWKKLNSLFAKIKSILSWEWPICKETNERLLPVSVCPEDPRLF